MMGREEERSAWMTTLNNCYQSRVNEKGLFSVSQGPKYNAVAPNARGCSPPTESHCRSGVDWRPCDSRQHGIRASGRTIIASRLARNERLLHPSVDYDPNPTFVRGQDGEAKRRRLGNEALSEFRWSRHDCRNGDALCVCRADLGFGLLVYESNRRAGSAARREERGRAVATKGEGQEDNQMTAREVIDRSLKETFHDHKGNPYQLRLKPGLSQTRLEELEGLLGLSVPAEVRELLVFTSGFSCQSFGDVDFSAKETFGLEEILPLGIRMATDGFGNEWVVDIRGDTGAWGPVLFMSHDPPVAVIQAPDLAGFIEQVLDLGRLERSSQIDFVAKTATPRIWSDDPYLLDLETARASSDPVMAEFSRQLPGMFRVADLRPLEVGSGFAWGRAGADAEIRRSGSELLFGVQIKESLFSRLLRRKP